MTQGTHLFGQVVTDQAQVDLVDQLVAHERGQRARLELFQPQLFAFALDDPAAHLLVGGKAGLELFHMLLHACQKIIDGQFQVAVDDTRVLTEQSADRDRQACLADPVMQRRAMQQQRRRLLDMALPWLRPGLAAQRSQPLGDQGPTR